MAHEAGTGTLDALFRQAVAVIDAGDVPALERLLAAHPELVRERLETPGAWWRERVGGALDGFFARPYLLWFVAEDPVRNDTLPANIADVAGVILAGAKREGVPNLQEQLDYALSLVSWSWVAARCGVQIALIDVLADAGAALAGNPENALVNRHAAAAEHLLKRGAPLTLGTALCLGRFEDAARLAESASSEQKQFALVLVALNGRAEGVRRAIALGAAPNTPSEHLYSHASPVHHAVCSGAIDTVRALVEAGADLGAKDTAWHATPLGWAEYYMRSGITRGDYAAIAGYLRGLAQGQPA